MQVDIDNTNVTYHSSHHMEVHDCFHYWQNVNLWCAPVWMRSKFSQASLQLDQETGTITVTDNRYFDRETKESELNNDILLLLQHRHPHLHQHGDHSGNFQFTSWRLRLGIVVGQLRPTQQPPDLSSSESTTTLELITVSIGASPTITVCGGWRF